MHACIHACILFLSLSLYAFILHPPTDQPARLTPTHRPHPPYQIHHHSIPEQIGRECEKAAKGIFPLSVVLIRKVKVLKKPKFDRKCPPAMPRISSCVLALVCLGRPPGP